jgi:hypothetical protein
MAQMRVATGTMDFGSMHEEAVIRRRPNVIWGNRRDEAKANPFPTQTWRRS